MFLRLRLDSHWTQNHVPCRTHSSGFTVHGHTSLGRNASTNAQSSGYDECLEYGNRIVLGKLTAFSFFSGGADTSASAPFTVDSGRGLAVGPVEQSVADFLAMARIACSKSAVLSSARDDISRSSDRFRPWKANWVKNLLIS